MRKTGRWYRLAVLAVWAPAMIGGCGGGGGSTGTGVSGSGGAPPAGRAWGAAQLIETGAGWADYPRVAMDERGNALVVWPQDDGAGSWDVWADRYDHATGWGTARLLGSHTSRPHVAMDPTGNGLAIWNQYENGSASIWVCRYEAQGGWGPPHPVQNGSAGSAPPWVAMDANGNALAVWSRDDGLGGTDVLANRYDPVGLGLRPIDRPYLCVVCPWLARRHG